MNVTRPYRMTQRREMVEETRERILQAGYAAWLDRPYDQVTLDAVAEAAGVSRQTVIRHFGSKDDLALGHRRLAAAHRGRGPRRRPGGHRHGRAPSGRSLRDDGRRKRAPPRARGQGGARSTASSPRARSSHRGWIERTFSPWLTSFRGARREELVLALYAATDVTVWKLLRRDLGCSRPRTESIIRQLVEGALGTLTTTTRRPREHASSLPHADVGGRWNGAASARSRPAAPRPRAFRPRPRRSDHPRAGGGGRMLVLALAAGTAPHRARPGPGPHEGLGDEQPARHAGPVRDRFVAGPAAAYTADTADAITATQPDAVVPDYLLFGAIMAAQAARSARGSDRAQHLGAADQRRAGDRAWLPARQGRARSHEGRCVAGRRQQAPRPRAADVERRPRTISGSRRCARSTTRSSTPTGSWCSPARRSTSPPRSYRAT